MPFNLLRDLSLISTSKPLFGFVSRKIRKKLVRLCIDYRNELSLGYHLKNNRRSASVIAEALRYCDVMVGWVMQSSEKQKKHLLNCGSNLL